MKDESGSDEAVKKIPTGIAGFDYIGNGGLPEGRTALVAGSAGSGKTIFACQFLAEGVRQGLSPGVFVTFEEKPQDIRRNMMSFGWNIGRWEEEGNWAFVDASPEPSFEIAIIGDYDFGALLARIEHAIRSIGAKRVVLDSIGAIFAQFRDGDRVRHELFRISSALRELGVTAIMTAERTAEYGEIARHGIEEFVADSVVILRNVLEDEKRRRTIEILKVRGTSHRKGEYPFTVIPADGIIVIPLSAIELRQRSGDIRVTSGNADLDRMCGGGLFRDSIILVSGATGTGKTLMVTHFVAGGAASDERCLLFAYEESREQLGRNATGWGIDFDRLEAEGKLKVICDYPEVREPRGPPRPDQGVHRGVQAQPYRRRQPLGAGKDLDYPRFSRVRPRRDLVLQARGDNRPVHVDDADADRRQLGDRGSHLVDHRQYRAPALRRALRRDAPRHHGAENARLIAREEHPRDRHRQHRRPYRRALSQRRRHPRR